MTGRDSLREVFKKKKGEKFVLPDVWMGDSRELHQRREEQGLEAGTGGQGGLVTVAEAGLDEDTHGLCGPLPHPAVGVGAGLQQVRGHAHPPGLHPAHVHRPSLQQLGHSKQTGLLVVHGQGQGLAVYLDEGLDQVAEAVVTEAGGGGLEQG